MKRNLFSGLDDLDVAQHLIAELHDDLRGRVARAHMLFDLGEELGLEGAMIPGGTIAYRVWIEARNAFINGQFVALVLLCQGLMEHILASQLEGKADPVMLGNKVGAGTTRNRAASAGIISDDELIELDQLEKLRNPFAHYRNINDPEHVDQQATNERRSSDSIFEKSAVFAITLTIKVLSKPSFRLGSF